MSSDCRMPKDRYVRDMRGKERGLLWSLLEVRGGFSYSYIVPNAGT